MSNTINVLANKGSIIGVASSGGSGQGLSTIEYSEWETLTQDEKAAMGFVEVLNVPSTITVEELDAKITALNNVATQTTKGLMSSSDKTKLDGIATGATNDRYTKDYAINYAGDGVIMSEHVSSSVPSSDVLTGHNTTLTSLASSLGDAQSSIDTINQKLSSKQDTSTAITTSNIGSQSVNYASSCGNADTVDGYHASYFINTSNIGSQSVNYASSCGNADTVDGYHAGELVKGVASSGWYSVTNLVTFTSSNNALIQGGKGNYIFGISSWSDKRLKENIKDSEVNGLEIISNIRLREFDYSDEKYGTHKEIGYIAQELQEIVPDCVVSVPDEDGGNYYQVEDKPMIPYLVKAIQELNAKIESQQKEIEELKKKTEIQLA